METWQHRETFYQYIIYCYLHFFFIQGMVHLLLFMCFFFSHLLSSLLSFAPIISSFSFSFTSSSTPMHSFLLLSTAFPVSVSLQSYLSLLLYVSITPSLSSPFFSPFPFLLLFLYTLSHTSFLTVVPTLLCMFSFSQLKMCLQILYKTKCCFCATTKKGNIMKMQCGNCGYILLCGVN
uniref:Uncharacterized protein n=1 Tax=Cacopsylla melanoneura TaxID=428564 RepID=A0A8D8QKW6_9HEMI